MFFVVGIFNGSNCNKVWVVVLIVVVDICWFFCKNFGFVSCFCV